MQINKRKVWLEKLEPRPLCHLIAIEFTCCLIEGMDGLPAIVKNALRKVHEISLAPQQFAAKQMLDESLAGMTSSYAFVSALSATVGTIIKGRNTAHETAIVSAAVVVAVPWEQQIEILRSVLKAHDQFGLPSSIEELAVCNDWLEEGNLVRLKTPIVLDYPA